MTVLKSSDKEMREMLDDKEYFLYENCRRGILNLDRRNKWKSPTLVTVAALW
jgi:hypothetical protein